MEHEWSNVVIDPTLVVHPRLCEQLSELDRMNVTTSEGKLTPKRKVAEGRPVLTKPPAFVLDQLIAKKPQRKSGKVSKRRAKNRVASQSRKVNRHKR
jgi:hypothetical protein